MKSEKTITEIIQESYRSFEEQLAEPAQEISESMTESERQASLRLLSLIKECERLVDQGLNENESTEKIKEEKRQILKEIFLVLKSDEPVSDFLLFKLIKICLKNSRATELLQFLIEKKKNELILKLFILMNPAQVRDYEDCLFLLAEYFSKASEDSETSEVPFAYLKYATSNGTFTLYPVFSLLLRKLCKHSRINEALTLLNYLTHNQIEIYTPVLNYMIESLSRINQIEEAINLFNKMASYEPTYTFPSDIVQKCKFAKLVICSGINIHTWGTLIKSLCRTNHLDLALYYYEELKEKNLINDEVIFNLLIDGCAKTSNLEQIKAIYFDMRRMGVSPTIVTFNTIIDAYIRVKDSEAAWKIYFDLVSKGIKPDNFTYSTLFRGIRNKSHRHLLERALLILEDLKEKNAEIDIILINVLLDSCISIKEEEITAQIFDRVNSGFYPNVKPDIITFNTFVKGCAQMNLFDKAFAAFELMFQQLEVKPNDVFFNTMIDVCVRCNKTELVWGIIEKMEQAKIKPDNFTYSTIIKGLNKNSHLNVNEEAGVESSNQPNPTNTLDSISNSNSFYSQKGQTNSTPNYSAFKRSQASQSTGKDIKSNSTELELAFKLFENVRRISKPDEILYNCIMDACLRFQEIDKMLSVYDEMIAEKIKPSSITCGIVIKGYGMKGNLARALEVYEEMKRENIEISSITYGCLINACIKSDNLDKAFDFYEEIAHRKIEMNTVLLTTLIKAYSKNKELNKVLEIFNQMKTDKVNSPNNITYNSVLDCCVKCHEIKLAERIFEEMLASTNKPDIVTFTTLIKGFMRTEKVERACDYLTMMEKFNVKPDDILLNSLLDGCEKLKRFKKGLEMFTYVRSFGVEPSFMAFSITMKILGKLGDYESSKTLMEEIKTKKKNISLIIFTCYMKTCFSTGHYEEAAAVLKSIKDYKLVPDSISYSTMLSGFSSHPQGKYAGEVVDILKESLSQNIFFEERVYNDVFRKISRNCEDLEEAEKLKNILASNDIHVKGNYFNENPAKKGQGKYNYLLTGYKHKPPAKKKDIPSHSTFNSKNDERTPLGNAAIKKLSNISTTTNYSQNDKNTPNNMEKTYSFVISGESTKPNAQPLQNPGKNSDKNCDKNSNFYSDNSENFYQKKNYSASYDKTGQSGLSTNKEKTPLANRRFNNF